MVSGAESADALESARQTLAARDSDLADADRALLEELGDAYAVAAGAAARIEAIGTDIEALATSQPRDTPAAARELSRRLVAATREIAEVVSQAEMSARTKTLALRQLSERYQPPAQR